MNTNKILQNLMEGMKEGGKKSGNNGVCSSLSKKQELQHSSLQEPSAGRPIWNNREGKNKIINSIPK